jgi:hypothetical protein
VSQVRKTSSKSGTYLCSMQGSECGRWTLRGCSLLGIGCQIVKDINKALLGLGCKMLILRGG